MSDQNWKMNAKKLLKAEMAKRDTSYNDLRILLAHLDIHKTAQNLRNIINNGTFTVYFLLQCAKALGIKKIYLDDYLD